MNPGCTGCRLRKPLPRSGDRRSIRLEHEYESGSGGGRQPRPRGPALGAVATKGDGGPIISTTQQPVLCGRPDRLSEKHEMMTVEAFEQSLTDAEPPKHASLALQALWWAGKGDWDRAHRCAQQQEGNPDCDLVHAYLHREEGDTANARCWYQRLGRSLPTVPL